MSLYPAGKPYSVCTRSVHLLVRDQDEVHGDFVDDEQDDGVRGEVLPGTGDVAQPAQVEEALVGGA